MTPTSEKRKYDLVLLGATGYTGKLCAEHITNYLPTDLTWAISGRSEHKLLDLLINLKNVNPDRKQPEIEISNLSPANLARLARTTKLLINTVGPYHVYSSPVVEACAENGTHYLDVTGESPWVLDMIKKHHDTAKQNHAIMIPQIGVESAPSDILVWMLAKLLRQNGCTAGIKETIGTVHEMRSAPSGGTLATALGIFDVYSVKEIAASTRWTHSPIQPPPKPQNPSPSDLRRTLLGVRNVAPLGILTTSINAGPNIATVQRSWGLLDSGKFYGPNFTYREYMTVRSVLIGAVIHFAIIGAMLLLALAPVRWAVSKLVYQPGQGAEREVTKRECLEQRCVATAIDAQGREKKAMARFRYEDGMYYMTGMLLAEAAMVVLRDEGKLEGGILTPACLGEGFVERLRGADNVLLECKMLE